MIPRTIAQELTPMLSWFPVVSVTGPHQSGKSTLITHFNGINKPTSGKVYIAGEDMWADPKDIRRFRRRSGRYAPMATSRRTPCGR